MEAKKCQLKMTNKNNKIKLIPPQQAKGRRASARWALRASEREQINHFPLDYKRIWGDTDRSREHVAKKKQNRDMRYLQFKSILTPPTRLLEQSKYNLITDHYEWIKGQGWEAMLQQQNRYKSILSIEIFRSSFGVLDFFRPFYKLKRLDKWFSVGK